MNIRKIRIPLFWYKIVYTNFKENNLLTSPNANAYLQTQTLTSASTCTQVILTPVSVSIYMDNYNFTTKPKTQTTEKMDRLYKTTPQTKNQTGQKRIHIQKCSHISSKNPLYQNWRQKMRAGPGCVCVQNAKKRD